VQTGRICAPLAEAALELDKPGNLGTIWWIPPSTGCPPPGRMTITVIVKTSGKSRAVGVAVSGLVGAMMASDLTTLKSAHGADAPYALNDQADVGGDHMTHDHAEDSVGDQQFINAIASLHRQKAEAYGNSWKRRGELISIMANIARKVDRLELMAKGAQPSQDENALDTAVDLYVYALKYLTYLADQDLAVAIAAFGEPKLQSWSDGYEGFEQLLSGFDMSVMSSRSAGSVSAAVKKVMGTFSELEMCFSPGSMTAPPRRRASLAMSLATDALQLVAALRNEDHAAYLRFLASWQARPT
jgi:hypothetical protein